MTSEQHAAQDRNQPSKEELDAIVRLARQQSSAHGDAGEHNEVDWRLLAYVALGGSVLVLIILQFAG